MAADLAFRLKEHMIYLLTKKLSDEYNDQTERWKKYIDDVTDAVDSATKHVQEAFVDAKAERQAAQEQAFGYAMLIFSMVAGPAVSWLGNAIKLKYAAKFLVAAPRIKMVTKVTWNRSPLGKEFMQFIPEGVVATDMPVANAVLGDASKSLAGWLADQGMKQLKPSQVGGVPLNTKFVQTSFSWQSLKTGLNQELYNAQNNGRVAIETLADSVEADVEFGEKLQARLFKEQPNLKTLKPPHNIPQQERAGQLMINKLLNDQRNVWAKQWFYYGNNPPVVKANLDVISEREIWAQWLLDQHVRLQPGGNYHVASDSDYLMTEAVQSRLRYIAMPNAFDIKTYDTELLQAVVDTEEIEGTGMPRTSIHPWAMKAKKAVSELVTWANTHVPEIGPLDYGRRRTLGPIESYTSPYHGNYKQS
jgi:hypothetical protein